MDKVGSLLTSLRPLERRAALRILGGTGVCFLSMAYTGWSPKLVAGALSAQSPVCFLTPEISEGPFYFPLNMVRSDVTEGKEGMPLKIVFRVLDAATCQPIPSAMIDFWQADATGNYSGYDFETAVKAMRGPFGPEGPPHVDPTNKLTFLRGISVSDNEGMAGFQSIYPGWYDHRAVHAHVKVRIDGHVVHTGQIFFPDDVSDAVFRTGLYAQHAGQRVLNKDDVLYRNGGPSSSFAVEPDSDKSLAASISLGVKRS